jgi:hypothetical protein
MRPSFSRYAGSYGGWSTPPSRSAWRKPASQGPAHMGLDQANRVVRADVILDPRRRQASPAASPRPLLRHPGHGVSARSHLQRLIDVVDLRDRRWNHCRNL